MSIAPMGRVLLTLELDAGSDPVVGTLRSPDGRASSFCGWLELFAALEAVRAAQHAERNVNRPNAGEASERGRRYEERRR